MKRKLALLFVRAVAALVCVSTFRGQAAEAQAPRPPETKRVNGVEVYALGFDILASFKYTIVDAGTGATPEEIEAAQKNDQVPDWIRFYDHKRVELTGYMLPLEIEDGRAKKFIMMKDVTTCCYGATPSMNDYVIVTMKGGGVTAIQDVPVELVGIFEVNQIYQDGYVVSLYVMEGETFLGERK